MSGGPPFPGNADDSTAGLSVCVERSIRATPTRIWEILGTEAGMARWMSMRSFQPRLGGRILLDSSGASEAERLIIFGRVLAIEPALRLNMSWRVLQEADGELWPDYTELELSLQEEAGGCRVRLRHSGFEKLAGFGGKAWSVYHHCWVQTGYMERLERQAEAEA